MSAIELFELLVRAVTLSFSGFGSVPMVQEELVRHGSLTPEQLSTAIAISQVTPGPLGLYVVSVGYFARGISGAVIGMFALGLPSLLSVWIEQAMALGSAERLQRVAAAIIIAAAMLLIVTGVSFSRTVVTTPLAFALAMVGTVLIATGRLAPIWVVLGVVAIYVTLT